LCSTRRVISTYKNLTHLSSKCWVLKKVHLLTAVERTGV
jgi:hypothetical protein